MRLKSVDLLAVVAGSSLALAGGEELTTDSSTEVQDLRILGVVAMTVFIATIIIYMMSMWMIACGSGSHEDPLSVVIGALVCGGLFLHVGGIVVGGVGAVTNFVSIYFLVAWYIVAGTMAKLQASCRWVAVAALVALLCPPLAATLWCSRYWYMHYPGCGTARSMLLKERHYLADGFIVASFALSRPTLHLRRLRRTWAPPCSNAAGHRPVDSV